MSLSKPGKKRKVDLECRVFNEQWTQKYFFVQNKNKAVCLICKDSVSVFKECNIKRHYDARHSEKYDVFQGHVRIEKSKKGLSGQQNIFKTMVNENLAAVRASFYVAELIAKEGRSFTDGEFVKRCLMGMAEELFPEKKKCVSDVSLSARTVTRRIEDIGDFTLSCLKNKCQYFTKFSLALDESSDISDTAQLLIFVRGIDAEFEITEELAGLKSLKGTTTGEEIFLCLSETLNSLHLNWKGLCSVTTDGAKNMVGRNLGVVARIKAEMELSNSNPPMQVHCIIHQQALCSKVMNWKSVMDIVVPTVNSIRKSSLNHRQFQQFLLETEAEYGDVLYYTEVRWLSRGKFLKRFFELRHEIKIFLTGKGKMNEKLCDPDWLWDLAFLADITQHLNDLNTRLQGKGKLVCDMFSDLKSFQVKLRLFAKQLSEGNLFHFPCCKSISQEGGSTAPRKIFTERLELLQKEFHARFQDFEEYSKDIRLFQNPFTFEIEEASEMYQLELIDIQTNDELKEAFHANTRVEFYKCLSDSSFPNLKELAAKMLTIFGSTYICEQTFSRMKFVKSKFRSRMTDDHLQHCLRISVTNFQTDVNFLAGKIQPQSSH